MSRTASFPVLRELLARAAEVGGGRGLTADHPCDARCEARAQRLSKLPARLTQPSLAVLAAAGVQLPASLAHLAAPGRTTAHNRKQLARLAALVARVGGATADTLLLGDAALLAVLYDDAGAFPLGLPIGALSGRTFAPAPHGEDTIAPQMRVGPGQPLVVPLGTLAPRAERQARPWSDGERSWLVPDRELLVVLLAARLGDPLAPPQPPLWHHLGLALLTWGEAIAPGELLALAGRFGLAAQLRRGLAIVRHLFPELRERLATRSLQLPVLEERLAVPLAARKVLGMALAEDVGLGDDDPGLGVAPDVAPTGA